MTGLLLFNLNPQPLSRNDLVIASHRFQNCLLVLFDKYLANIMPLWHGIVCLLQLQFSSVTRVLKRHLCLLIKKIVSNHVRINTHSKRQLHELSLCSSRQLYFVTLPNGNWCFTLSRKSQCQAVDRWLVGYRRRWWVVAQVAR